MGIWLISYTARGRALAARVADILKDSGHDCRTFALPKFCEGEDEALTASASDWAGAGFAEADALIFCCASGIAVRAIAPHVRDKRRDPAVLVLDEGGTFVIPLLSGHLGGANALAKELAAKLPATPVLTTATDVNGLFAVDVFAKNNDLFIEDMALAKAVSAALLSGEAVGFRSDLPVAGALPKGLAAGKADLGILVSSSDEKPFPRTLRLIPRRYAVGLGCRRGKDEAALEAFLRENLNRCGVGLHQVMALASIDIKGDEPGLVVLAKELGLPFVTYSAEELKRAPGEFTPSAFVQGVTGVDSVCERAAVLASGGTLMVRKVAENGMTFALAKKEEGIRFE
ncbi:MAG: cobalt-precorrin 5A hydrolase [Clostridia bacterium]|nr:cobalt-precorrin 5A hydrolase [Clostridia bacterium]